MKMTLIDQAGFRLQGLLLTRIWERARGWMMRQPSPAVEALLIAPCPSVHFWGVSQTLDVLFIGESGRVLRHLRDIAPGARPVWHLGAWGVVEVISGRRPQNWQPKAFSWQQIRP